METRGTLLGEIIYNEMGGRKSEHTKMGCETVKVQQTCNAHYNVGLSLGLGKETDMRT